MIRQAISCDICGTEKRQTNHWFVARESAGELHVGGWNSRHRTGAGSKHLCGQICLHKLVDEYMARTLSPRIQPAATEPAQTGGPSNAKSSATKTGLASTVAFPLAEPAARLANSLAPLLVRRPPAAAGAGPVAVHSPLQLEPALAPLADEPLAHSTRTWRAEPWEREIRSAARPQNLSARRRS